MTQPTKFMATRRYPNFYAQKIWALGIPSIYDQ